MGRSPLLPPYRQSHAETSDGGGGTVQRHPSDSVQRQTGHPAGPECPDPAYPTGGRDVLAIISKVPGSKARTHPVEMNFKYGDTFGAPSPEAYERLLLDVMAGD